jgi:hypothetical protein
VARVTAHEWCIRIAQVTQMAMPRAQALPVAQAAADRILANRSMDVTPTMMRWEQMSTERIVDEALQETPDGTAYMVAAFDRAASLDQELDTDALAACLRYLAAAHLEMAKVRASITPRRAA